MLRHHPNNHTRPRVENCDQCHRALVLIDYYGKLLKGCLSCNVWGRPSGRTWTRLPHDDLRALERMMPDNPSDQGRVHKRA